MWPASMRTASELVGAATFTIGLAATFVVFLMAPFHSAIAPVQNTRTSAMGITALRDLLPAVWTIAPGMACPFELALTEATGVSAIGSGAGGRLGSGDSGAPRGRNLGAYWPGGMSMRSAWSAPSA